MTTRIVTLANESHEVTLDRDGDMLRSGEHTIEIVALAAGDAELRVDGVTHFVPYALSGTKLSFAYDGEIYSADVADKGVRAKRKSSEHSMAAPMPGLVLKILIKPGDVVAKGAPLLILEAMKMEHQIVAPRDGSIAAVNCKEGELVQPGVDLVVMNDEDQR